MNNEPVAWRIKNPQMFNEWVVFPNKEQASLYAFHNGKGNLPEPLYTHPHSEESVKAKTLTLTPDEIFDIWDEHTDYDGNFISDIDTFVLAILRKAQEK